MSQLLMLGEVVGAQARLAPDKIGARDSRRALTFAQWNERACRLANALLGLGLAKGDRVALLAYNCVEWMEIYVALAKAGLVAVPINFRLVGAEIEYIVDDAKRGRSSCRTTCSTGSRRSATSLAIAPAATCTSAARRRRPDSGPTRR